MKRNLVAFLPLALWAAAVLTVGSLENLRTPTLPPHADKVAHFIMYGVGGVLAAWAGWIRGLRAGMIALLLVIITGALDELHQTTLATRDGNVADWVADTLGAIFFYLATTVLLRRK